MGTASFRTGYFDKATNIDDLETIIAQAKVALADIEFDTLVGTGFSGGVVIPALALALRKNFVLIRKEDDDSHHGGGKLIGTLGERWIFVDDFVSSGSTRRRVMNKIMAACVVEDHATTMVGQYMYVHYGEGVPALVPFYPEWTEELY